MRATKVVIDTNVFVAAIRSRRGASFALVSLLGTGRFDVAISVPLILEYEEVMKRHAAAAGITVRDVDDIIDYVCAVADRREIYFLWRPFLKDLKDDFILEVAVEAGCDFIVTHNLRDFSGVERLGLSAITPGAFLRKLENRP